MFRQALRLATRVGVRSLSTSAASQAAGSGRRALLAGAAGVALGGAALVSTMPTAECSWSSWLLGTTDWEAVRKEIEKVIEDNEAGPLFVRLAWHCAGTYDKNTNTGGSNGATMRFQPEADHGANKGLNIARDLLEPIKAKFPGVSYADLYTFAGKAAIEYMGGPTIPWKAGRSDAVDGTACPKDGNLPDAAQGSSHIRDIFYRMGFNDQEIVALIGAHTLGRCHTDRSGYEGPWTFDPNGFDNAYFTLLLSERWTIRPNFKPLQYEDSSKQLMMLPADLALIIDPKFRVYVELYAKEPETFNKDFAAAFGKLLELGVPRK